MNFHTTGVQTSATFEHKFIYHTTLKKEIDKYCKKHKSITEAFGHFERLCKLQFNPFEPRQVIAPAKLHRVYENTVWTMWKIELMLPNSGLRPNQMPRVCFVVHGQYIYFLSMNTHVNNYSTDELVAEANCRLGDVLSE